MSLHVARTVSITTGKQYIYILLHEREGNMGKYSAQGMSVLARPEGGTIHTPKS